MEAKIDELHKFGTLLRRYRTAAGLSQEDLAERSGLSVRGISDLERGARTQPRLETVRMLVDGLALSEQERQALFEAARPELLDADTADRAHRAGRSIRFQAVPIPPTRMVGREKERQRLLGWFQRDGVRLGTLTGQGGIGKSRLALELALDLRKQSGIDTTFIDLSPLRDPDRVPGAIAAHLDITVDASQPVADALAIGIGETSCLLILDNWEQVIDAATLVATLLGQCPNLAVLATSREPLRLRGERELRLQPLALPTEDWERSGTDHEPAAVQLFLERVQELQPDFEITGSNRAALYEICQRLEGLPLALEIAAAHVRSFSIIDLRDQLRNSLDILTDGPRDLPERQKTMDRTIAWSVDLLDSGELETFYAVSTFIGGFDFAHLLQVCGNDVSEVALEARIGSLVSKSLVQRDQRREPSRFYVPETIREYGLARLRKQAENARFEERHAAIYLEEARVADALLRSPEPMAEFHRLEMELGNLRAAFRRLMRAERVREAAELATALAWFWTDPKYLSEGRGWYGQLLANAGALNADLHARTLMSAGDLAQWELDVDAAEAFQVAALEIWRNLDDRFQIAASLRGLASAAMEHGEYARADELLTEARAVAQDSEHQWELAAATNLLGLSGVFQGDAERAIRLHEEALKLWLDLGDRNHIATARGSLAWAYLQSGQLESSSEQFLQTLDLALESEDELLVLWAITGAASLAFVRFQDVNSATRLVTFTTASRERIGTPLWAPLKQAVDDLIKSLETELGTRRYEMLANEGRQLDRDNAIERARLILST